MNEEAIFEVRVLRSRVLQLAAILGWVGAMILIGLFLIVCGEFVLLVAPLGLAAPLTFILVRAFERERAVAEEVVREFRARFGRA